ncbi:HAD family phosphatase [Streptomyces sp. Edi2]|uniref:HAD family hydrolase n=1 Tax=Streptomyces sp. Edi2 TaxID=3162528 RepID=UPI00330616B8
MASNPALSAAFPLPIELEAIVFDCDGLLLDTETCWSRAEGALFRAHGREFGLAEKQLVIGKTVEGVGEVMADYFGRPGEGELLSAELLEGVRRELADGVAALPGAADLVRACAERLPVAVASNSPRSLLETALGSSGLADLLPLSFAADEVAAPKPAPDLYLTACRALGADPASCVAFEDSHTGIRAARAAGLHLVTVPSLAGQELDHDWLLDSLADPQLQAWARALRPAVAPAAHRPS